MGLIRIVKNPVFVLLAVIIMVLFAGGMAFRALDKALNESIGKNPHTEVMLWKSPGYPSNPQLYLFGTEVHPNPEKIIVNYRIQNKSDKAISIRDLIDVAVVKADANTIGDPGTLIWRWSQNYNEQEIKNIELGPGEFYQKEIAIDRKEIDLQSQYYINAYYDGDLVAQYKIIEGIYDK